MTERFASPRELRGRIRGALRCLTACALVGIATGAWALTAVQTTVNGHETPLGIGNDDIAFGWAIEADVRNVVHGACQLRVGTTPGAGDIWDSGRVATDRQLDFRLPDTVALEAGTRYYWQVRLWDGEGNAGDWSEPAWFETGLTNDDWADAEWITRDDTDGVERPLPLLRGTFDAARPVRRARLYASARGVYQITLNGAPASDQFLAPGWTDYNTRIQSQTYDITDLVREGHNAIGVALGDGWYRGTVGIGWKSAYGNTLSFIARVRLDYEDGTSEWFNTDGSWLAGDSPRLQADLQHGEVYDARLEQPRWDTPDFDAAGWRPVRVPGDDRPRLVPQPDEPVRVVEVLRARGRTSPTAGTFVYDLGQNMVGVVRVRMTGRAGQTVTLRHGEELYRSGERAGQLYTDNLRGARATDAYTFGADGTVVWQPLFTQHGFRYVEITGLDTPPAAEDVEGIVLASDLPDIGDLRLDHPMLDQLVRNIRWGQRGNFLSVPTDTPARDERLGWTGDINVFAPTAGRLQDTRAFLGKWMTDVRDSQRPDGNPPAVVPQPAGQFAETGVGWADAVITVPWAVWRATGDTAIVRQNWDAMCRFQEFLIDSASADGNLIEEGRVSFFSGDWLNLENVDRLEEHRVIATAYFAENTRRMAEMAAVLGESEKAGKWAALVPRIREAFTGAFVADDGTVYTGTQTVYAMALGMDLIPDAELRTKVAGKFVEKLAADDHHLRTGFLGTPWLLPALTSIGRDDLAMRLLLNETYPSWGFEISMGATTMWERWNSLGPDGEFGPVSMNSFNHYAYGAVGDWMFDHLGGLQIVEPGYRRVRIAPLLGHGGPTRVDCSVRTARGLVASQWQLEGDRLTLNVVVPPNTSADVVIPAVAADAVTEGGRPATDVGGVRSHAFADGQLTLHIGSGRYAFVARVQAEE